MFADRVAERLPHLRPAERRVARYFENNREEVLISSALSLAAKVRTSDATIVRASKALGFAGLDELRRALADEMRGSTSPATRLLHTLAEVGDAPSAALELTVDIHLRALTALRHAVTSAQFERAIAGIIGSRRIVVFGLGPSSAIARYFVIQLGRFGLDGITLTHTGLLFADDIRSLRDGDLVVMLAYGRIYAELAALLDEIERRRLRSLLVTDTLATLQGRVDLVFEVARGQAEMFSMHTATLGFIEALLVGVAAKRPQETLDSLRDLNRVRTKLAGRSVRLPETSQ